MNMLREELYTEMSYALVVFMSWNNIVSKVTGHGLKEQGFIPSWHRDLSLYHNIKINSEDHPAHSSMDIESKMARTYFWDTVYGLTICYSRMPR